MRWYAENAAQVAIQSSVLYGQSFQPLLWPTYCCRGLPGLPSGAAISPGRLQRYMLRSRGVVAGAAPSRRFAIRRLACLSEFAPMLCYKTLRSAGLGVSVPIDIQATSRSRAVRLGRLSRPTCEAWEPDRRSDARHRARMRGSTRAQSSDRNVACAQRSRCGSNARRHWVPGRSLLTES